MKFQNLTVKISVETIRRAKVLAAHRGTSISALVTETIEELVGEDAQFVAGRRHALRRLERGWHLGGRVPSRADVRG